MISGANASPRRDVRRLQGSEIDSGDGEIIDVGCAAPTENESTDMMVLGDWWETEQAKMGTGMAERLLLSSRRFEMPGGEVFMEDSGQIYQIYQIDLFEVRKSFIRYCPETSTVRFVTLSKSLHPFPVCLKDVH